MKRFVLAVAATSLVVVLLIGGLGFVAVRSLIGPRIAEAAAMAPWATEIPSEFQGLQDLSPAERFGHFLGGQLRFTDAGNAGHVVSVTPGTVLSVSSDALTIKPNDSAQGGSKTFKLTTDTRIHVAGQPWQGQSGTQATPKKDDKVVVVAVDDTTKAVMIGGPDGFRPGPGFGPFHHGGPAGS